MYSVKNLTDRKLEVNLVGGREIRVPSKGVESISDDERNSPELLAMERHRPAVASVTKLEDVPAPEPTTSKKSKAAAAVVEGGST